MLHIISAINYVRSNLKVQKSDRPIPNLTMEVLLLTHMHLLTISLLSWQLLIAQSRPIIIKGTVIRHNSRLAFVNVTAWHYAKIGLLIMLSCLSYTPLRPNIDSYIPRFRMWYQVGYTCTYNSSGVTDVHRWPSRPTTCPQYIF